MRPKIREVSFSFFWKKLETIPLVFDNVQKFIVPDIFLFSLVILFTFPGGQAHIDISSYCTENGICRN